MIDQIAKVLCAASRFHDSTEEEMHRGKDCLFCGRGPCDPAMWQTFLPEARAVHSWLVATGKVSAGRGALPGLGAPL